MTKTDEECLELAIRVAEDTFSKGNYPVGAVLAIDHEIVASAGNEINTKKSYVNHAENFLIINNGVLIAEAYDQGKEISLYSTLEPCIQCLGASVTNHINRIIYIQTDPNGGACNLKHDNIGLWYRETWPNIEQVPFSTKPKEMMINFFKQEIKKGNIKWPTKMLGLLDTKDI
ncbi:nucleoside deaminase [Candidatus Dojkabacteria bacterium]|uniref:Nucleoside deaminase n=1 Tax=Candidatus Dojkabacteria bacterium TaxID=2099670 RepID=A0A955RIF2_9BACT|nr:nucleoside deaminase [Candidatus Dojkabacteria bacterium]